MFTTEDTYETMQTQLVHQALIISRDVPLNDGYKRNLRHEGNNIKMKFGSLAMLATLNFADLVAMALRNLSPSSCKSRRFQYGDRKVYNIPAAREQDMVRLFRKQDPTAGDDQ